MRRNRCARAYYEAAGGVVEAAQSTLRYDDPNPDLLAWLKAAACHSFSASHRREPPA